MSELQPTLTPENLGSRIDAVLLTDETKLDFHASDLQSVEEGLRAARAAIDAQLSHEQPPRPTAQQELTEMGRHLADFRAWSIEPVEGGRESARSFRTTLADFEQATPRARYPESRVEELQQRAEVNGDFSQWASEFPQRPSEIGTDFEELAPSRR